MAAARVADGRSAMLGFFFFQAEDGIRDVAVTGVQTCALPIFDLYGAANSTAAAANSATETSAKTVEVSRLRVSNANNCAQVIMDLGDRKSTRLNSSHGYISYAVFCLKKKKTVKSEQKPRNPTI